MKTIITLLTCLMLFSTNIIEKATITKPVIQKSKLDSIKALEEEITIIEKILKEYSKKSISYEEIKESTVDTTKYRIDCSLDYFTIYSKNKKNEICSTSFKLPIFDKTNLVDSNKVAYKFEKKFITDTIIICEKKVNIEFINKNLGLYEIQFSGFTPVIKSKIQYNTKISPIETINSFYFILNNNDRDDFFIMFTKYLNKKIEKRKLELTL
jgi:hypothetical protein